MPTIHNFNGYKPSQPDHRDYYRFVSPLSVALPSQVDLRFAGTVSPVIDQGALGSCTGCSLAALREHLDLKAGKPLTKLSELFIYWQERYLEGTITEDAGAEPRDGFKVLQKIGVCPEKDDPYNIAKFTRKPTAKAVKDAAKFRISSYSRILNLAGVKASLASGYGVLMGFAVYESFETDERLATRGIMPVPQPGEKLLGGHAVMIAGYSDVDQWLIVKNSWGIGFGDNGYFYMPYSYVNLPYVSDLWSAVL